VNRFKIFAPTLKASMGSDNVMRLHGIASSTVKDRHGDTMSPSALVDMERSANNNLTIFLNHSYTVPEDVAGHVERAIIRSHPQDPDIHDLALDIAINMSNQRAKDAWAAINDGTQLGLSIGAMIPEGGAERDRKSGSYQINHVELLETSLVGVPANPRSWVEYAVKSLGGRDEITKAELTAEDFEHTDDPPETVPDLPTETGPEPAEVPSDATVDDNAPATEKSVKAPEGDPRESVPGEPIQDLDTGPEEGSPEDPSVDAETGKNVTTPDITDATVSIEMPNGGKVHIDTGNRGTPKTPDAGEASQEALLSAPETEDQDDTEDLGPWAGILPVKSALIDTDVKTALEMLEPSVVASLRNSTELLKAITRELIDTKAALEQRNDEYAALEEATKAVVTKTGLILDKLSNTPVGRRAVIREASDQFANLKSVYSEEFLTLLKRS
jgi:HK97 family phage prohead protease